MGPEELSPTGPWAAPPLHPVHGPGPLQGLARIQESDSHSGPQAHVCRGRVYSFTDDPHFEGLQLSATIANLIMSAANC